MSDFTAVSLRARRLGVLIAILSTALVGTLLGCAAPSGTTPTPASSSATPAADGPLPAEVQAELQSTLDESMTEFTVPGALVGVWIPGEGSWTTAAGLADIDNATAPTLDMSWPIRSVTKSFTVTLILQLVDEGTLSLDDTIDQYVDGVTNGDRITLRELAGMSSGNADYTTEAFQDVFLEDQTRLFTLDELNSFVIGQPAQFQPGAEHVYTNANTNLLGAVIEKVTGQSYAEVIDERILQPLGLDHTRYILDASTWTEPHALGYGPPADPREPFEQNFSILGPAGSLISTVDDARTWVEALATGALLSPETQAERLKGSPLDSGPPYGMYALGIGETDGWWGHNGEGLGFTVAVFHNPTSGATIVVYTNESNADNGIHPADATFRRLAAIVDSE